MQRAFLNLFNDTCTRIYLKVDYLSISHVFIKLNYVPLHTQFTFIVRFGVWTSKQFTTFACATFTNTRVNKTNIKREQHAKIEKKNNNISVEPEAGTYLPKCYFIPSESNINIKDKKIKKECSKKVLLKTSVFVERKAASYVSIGLNM